MRGGGGDEEEKESLKKQVNNIYYIVRCHSGEAQLAGQRVLVIAFI